MLADFYIYLLVVVLLLLSLLVKQKIQKAKKEQALKEQKAKKEQALIKKLKMKLKELDENPTITLRNIHYDSDVPANHDDVQCYFKKEMSLDKNKLLHENKYNIIELMNDIEEKIIKLSNDITKDKKTKKYIPKYFFDENFLKRIDNNLKSLLVTYQESFKSKTAPVDLMITSDDWRTEVEEFIKKYLNIPFKDDSFSYFVLEEIINDKILEEDKEDEKEKTRKVKIKKQKTKREQRTKEQKTKEKYSVSLNRAEETGNYKLLVDELFDDEDLSSFKDSPSLEDFLSSNNPGGKILNSMIRYAEKTGNYEVLNIILTKEIWIVPIVDELFRVGKFSSSDNPGPKILNSMIRYAEKTGNYEVLNIILTKNIRDISIEDFEKIIDSMIRYAQKSNDFNPLANYIPEWIWEKPQDKFIQTVFNYLIKENRIKELGFFIAGFYKCGPGDEGERLSKDCIWSIVLLNKLNNKIKLEILNTFKKGELLEPDYLMVTLWLESDLILKELPDTDFSNNPIVKNSKDSLRQKHDVITYKDNFPKFYKNIEKIIKTNKPILALYLLNKYSGQRRNETSDLTLAIDLYIKAFIMLDKIDILAKYYQDFDFSNQNIEFLQKVTEYYILQNDFTNALIVLDNIKNLEPKYPFIELGLQKIEKLKMIKQLADKNIDMNSINTLSGKDFELLLIDKFKQLGFVVIDTPVTGDFGADIIVDTKDETRFVIQCKRFKSKVNLKAVQEVVGALPHYNGDIGIVITNNTFLASAIKLAKSNDIELWDNIKLMKFLSGDISFSQLSE